MSSHDERKPFDDVVEESRMPTRSGLADEEEVEATCSSTKKAVVRPSSKSRNLSCGRAPLGPSSDWVCLHEGAMAKEDDKKKL